MKLLFVCSGNTCRSPLAVAAWRALSDAPPHIEASSAGLAANSGAPASDSVIAIARDWKVDLSRHRSRPVDERLLRDSDLICAMTPNHALQLLARATRCGLDIQNRIVLLGNFAASSHANGGTDVARLQRLLGDESAWISFNENSDQATILDPFGGSREAYQSCAAQIQCAIAGLNRALASGRFPHSTP